MPDVSSILLTKQNERLLKRISRKKLVDRRDANDLLRLGLVDYAHESKPDQNGFLIFSHVIITDKGLRYLRWNKEKNKDKLWGRWLSIIAILISLAALALEIESRGWFTQ